MLEVVRVKLYWKGLVSKSYDRKDVLLSQTIIWDWASYNLRISYLWRLLHVLTFYVRKTLKELSIVFVRHPSSFYLTNWGAACRICWLLSGNHKMSPLVTLYDYPTEAKWIIMLTFYIHHTTLLNRKAELHKAEKLWKSDAIKACRELTSSGN